MHARVLKKLVYQLKKTNKQTNKLFLQICEIWGNLVKNWYIVNNGLIKVRIQKRNTYNCDYLPHAIFRFYRLDFQLNTDFLSQFFVFFTVNLPTITERAVSKENAFKKNRNQSAFFPAKL